MRVVSSAFSLSPQSEFSLARIRRSLGYRGPQRPHPTDKSILVRTLRKAPADPGTPLDTSARRRISAQAPYFPSRPALASANVIKYFASN
jgi:hypothetical protein